MLISQEVEVTLSGSNVKYYENLGYEIPKYWNSKHKKYTIKQGTKIIVKVNDIQKGSSSVMFDLECDYCGKPYKSVCDEYYRHNINGNIHKDACKNCCHLKSAEANMLLYGVDNSQKRPEVRKKLIDTCLEKYGKEDYMSTEEFKDKRKITCKEIYGFESASSNENIKNKIRNSQNFKIDFIREEFNKRDYILISESYINNNQDLEYICNKHRENGIQTIRYADLQQGEGCRFCAREHSSEIQRHDYDFVKREFEKKNLILLEDKYINSRISMKYICKNHPKVTQEISFESLYNNDSGCYYCSVERRSGSNHYKWNGGITDLQRYLRERIVDWKKKSAKQSNYKCVITGNKFDIIHHTYSFSKILHETLDSLKLPIYDEINKYNNEQLKNIENECCRIHDKHIGVCLSKDIHKLYHSIYGYDSTPEQFEEFKQRYKSGEFNNLLAS